MAKLTGFTLAAKRFEAVGDSLTEGENGRLVPSLPFIDLPNTYPTKLQDAFNATYPGQGITVINRGISGWPIERTVEELPADLKADQPDAVLAGHCGGNERVMPHQVHAKNARPSCHLHADATQANDSQSLAAKFRTLQRLLLPSAGAGQPVSTDEMAG